MNSANVTLSVSNVSLKKVYKRYGSTEIVKGIDLEIGAHEFVVLVGPSGCGKSTTLRMIAGLEEISDGTVSIGERVVNKIPPKDRDVAMVFQNYALYPHLSVAENIAFGLKLRKTPKDRVKAAVDEASSILSLDPYLERKPSDLSGGQRQRVAMGRAIVRHPKVFLFDEPLSNLDAKLRTQMRAEIKRLHKRLQVTTVYVTHDQVEAMTLADRIVIMRDGKIEQIGTPMDVFLHPANTFVASFIGSPPMNLLDGKIRKSDGKVAIELNDGCIVPVPHKDGMSFTDGQEVRVGFRPEDLDVVVNDQNHTAPMNCSVDLVEPLGSEALLHLQIAGQSAVAKTTSHGRSSDMSGIANTTQVFGNLKHLHIFDRASEQSIY
uniref:ABC transporter ATP-binding protein n=1 Tax=Marinobacterium profundum TaxID=1714300 RepID=UPI000AF69D53|nr:sn-glycerol-3-phosphate ABC transporter ATP-binding protein UgpC [Marinobacterium profundum]